MTINEKMKEFTRLIDEIILIVEEDEAGKVMSFKMKFPKHLNYLNDIYFLVFLPNVILEYEYFELNTLPVVKIPFYTKF